MLGDTFEGDIVISADKAVAKKAVKSGILGEKTLDLSTSLYVGMPSNKNRPDLRVMSEVGPRKHGSFVKAGSMILAQKQSTIDFDKYGLCVFFTDMKGKIDDCNAAACTLIDRTRREVLGLSPETDLVIAEQKIQTRDAVMAGISGKDTEIDMCLQTKMGQTLYMLAQVPT